jgi:hypothetical protein
MKTRRLIFATVFWELIFFTSGLVFAADADISQGKEMAVPSFISTPGSSKKPITMLTWF